MTFLIFISAFTEQDDLDLILSVDTSASMELYFNDLIKYIVSGILKDSLHPSDTFHLIRFAESPVFELAQPMKNDGAMNTVLNKLLFLKQTLFFGKYTDIIAAIENMINYAKTLPPDSKKVLILITDGINDPPPESPYYGMNQKDVIERLKKLAHDTIKKFGWTVRIIIYPSSSEGSLKEKSIQTQSPGKGEKSADTTESPSEKVSRIREEENKNNLLNIFKDSLNADVVPYDEKEKEKLPGKVTGFPELIFPGDMGKQGRKINVPFKIQNFQDNSLRIRLISLFYDDKNILAHKSVEAAIRANSTSPFIVPITLPPDFPIGQTEIHVTLEFDRNLRIWPMSGSLSFNYTGDVFVAMYKSASDYIFIIIIVFIIICVALVIYFFIRLRIFDKLFSDILRPADHSERLHGHIPPFADLIEMKVAFQNPHIGFRNIHKIDEGKHLTIGGGNSSFLIFLIPIPSHIARISKEGGIYVFTPIKTEFFPEIGEPIADCINKEILVVSKHGYRTILTFHKYVSPLTELNNMLHSINQSI
jgi:hypothetical protein